MATKTYYLNEVGRQKVMAFLREEAAPETFEYAERSVMAQQRWFADAEFSLNNGITPHGHLEIGPKFSRTGNPVTRTFDRDECFDFEE